MIQGLVDIAREKGVEALESFKVMLGVDDDLKAREEYQSSFHTDSLASLLPYYGWHDGSELFILDKGDHPEEKSKKTLKVDTGPKNFLGFCLEANPQTGADDSMKDILQGIYLQAPAGSSITVHLYASPDVMSKYKRMAKMRYSDASLGIAKEPHEKRNINIYQTMTRKSIDYWLHGSHESLFKDSDNFLLRDFRLVVSVVVPGSYRKESDIERTMLIRDQIKSTLISGNLPSITWTPADLINFVADFVDHSRMFHIPSKIDKPYEDHQKIRDQIIGREQEIEVTKKDITFSNSMSKELSSVVQLSVSQYPKNFHLAQMSGLIGDFFQPTLSYPCPFMITTSAVIQEYDSMRTKAAYNTGNAVRKAEGYMAKFDPLLIEEAHEWRGALAAIDDGGTLIKMSTQVTLITKKKHVEKAKAEVMAIWRGKGFRLADDRYQQLVSFLSSLPMTLTPPMISDLEKMKRFSTKYSQNAVALSPYIAEWKGSGTPVLNFFGRRGQLVNLDLFDNKQGNYNFSITGASGSGKTFVTQELLNSYRAVGAKIWVIDVGRGYENLCKIFDGEFVEFTEDTNIIINPFSSIIDIKEEMDMLKPLIGQMMSPNQDLTAWEQAALEQAINDCFIAKGTKMTITDLAEYLKSGMNGKIEDKRLSDMGETLFPWTREGAYGKYFDGEANISFMNDFTVLELEELSSKKHLQSVVLMIMMHRISNEMYLKRDRKKIVLIDEAWQLMTSGMTGAFVENGYRRARRYGGAFGTATQGFGDYTGGAAAALNNADWTFVLRQKEESISAMEKMNILSIHTDPYKKRVIKDLKKVDGKYSEIYVSYPSGEGVVRFVADSFKQLLYSSKDDDFTAINNYKSQGYSVTESVEMVMRDKHIPQPKPLKYE